MPTSPRARASWRRSTGARLLLSAHDRGELYEVRFPHEGLKDGEDLQVGSARIVARHTPGHTPEHLSFLVYDMNRASKTPMLMLSGDFLFIGSLGRPDLLGEEAKRALAEQLYDSVQKLEDLPDGLEVHPGHGSGSMCGSGMSDRPFSTLGFERIANPYLKKDLSRDDFLERLLRHPPPFPPYYKRMKTLNSEGPPALNGLPGLKAIGVGEFRHLAGAGHVVVDLRGELPYGAGHIPQAFGLGAGSDLSTWASWVVPYDTPILLVDEDGSSIESAVRSLVRVGLDRVEGFLEGGMSAWESARLPVASTPQLSPTDLHDRLKRGEPFRVIDVRSGGEWHTGHIKDARHIMGGCLADRVDELRDGDTPIAVVCGQGYRSTVAASVLERAGIAPVFNVTGGMTAWEQAGLPVTQ
jgi:hydroxyacylglutathione hydrolase